MLKMRPYAPPDRIAIRDSIDEECSDDIEDDVFIRDAKSAKLNEEKGLKRPLMAPRRKNSKTPNPVPIMKKRRRCWKCCEPFCYGLTAVVILIALIFLAALLLTLFPIPLQKIKVWLRRDIPFTNDLRTNNPIGTEIIPCTQIGVQRAWSRTFTRLNSESPVRKADVNGDNIDDVIFGYGFDDSIQYEDILLPKCLSARQDEQIPCDGGVIALNGVTGEILWQRWSVSNVFSLFCTMDIDNDNVKDCVAAGRGGLIFAISGKNGEVLWNFREIEVETNSPILIDLYTINAIQDLDDDEIPDILAVHVEERESSRAGHIKLISGKTGKVIRSLPTPFREEVFVPLQLITKQDGTELVLIITGGQNTPGGLYTIRLHSLMQYTSEKEFVPLYQTESSGFMVAAILTDITGDSIDDIVVSSFNSTIYAFDGRNSSMIWSYSFPASESVSSVVPGHFDNDNVTDFMIKYNTGPGFPVYYYSQTTILSGVNGQPLLESMITDSGGPNSLLGGLSISQAVGGDLFLHWQTQCRGKFDFKDAYQFIPDSDIVLQARADTCLLRYNTSTVLKLYALSRHVEPPGVIVFSSDDLNIHLNRSESRQLLQQNSVSPIKHPKMTKKLMIKDFVPPPPPPISNNERPATILTNNNIIEKKLKETPPDMISRNLENSNLGNPENMRNRLFETKILDLPDQGPEPPIRTAYDQLKPYFYMPYNNQPARDFKDYEPDQRNQEEYETLYNDDQQNERPIHLRSKYPNNRDVRSDFVDYDADTSNETSSSSQKQSLQDESSLSNNDTTMKKEDHKLNLWDLELEKEKEESDAETQKYDYNSRQRRDDESSSSPRSTSNSFKDATDKFLASISSTGILLNSLDKTASSIDFAFVLNVRESEIYPPLFLPEDLACVEDKMSGYRSFTNDDLLALEKQFLKKCLRARLPNIAPRVPIYESQIVISRITISCTCPDLQKNEVCSKVNSIDKQKWSEFLGNTGNGLYN